MSDITDSMVTGTLWICLGGFLATRLAAEGRTLATFWIALNLKACSCRAIPTAWIRGSASNSSTIAFSSASSQVSKGNPMPIPFSNGRDVELPASGQRLRRLKSADDDHWHVDSLNGYLSGEACNVGWLDAQNKCQRIVGNTQDITASIIPDNLSMSFRLIYPIQQLL